MRYSRNARRNKRFIRRTTSKRARTLRFATKRNRPSRSLRRFAKNFHRLAEVKSLATTLDANIAYSVWNSTQIELPTTGAQDGQKIGRAISLRYWKFKGVVENTQADIDPDNNRAAAAVRMVVAWPRRNTPDHQAPNIFYDFFDPKLYNIIHDKTYNLGATFENDALNQNANAYKWFDFTTPVKKTIHFNNLTTGETDDTMPMIFYRAYGGTQLPRIKAISKITYTDA